MGYQPMEVCPRAVLQRSISLFFLLLQWVEQKEARLSTAATPIADPLVLLNLLRPNRQMDIARYASISRPTLIEQLRTSTRTCVDESNDFAPCCLASRCGRRSKSRMRQKNKNKFRSVQGFLKPLSPNWNKVRVDACSDFIVFGPGKLPAF